MKNILIVLIASLVLGVGGYFLLNSNSGKDSSSSNDSSSNTSSSSSSQVNCADQTDVETVTVKYTTNGFSPKEATVEQCGKILWVNESTERVEIGVDPHPIHTGDKTITDGKFTLDIDSGEQKDVTVSKTGTFKYHNHLASSEQGTIIVK